jgi:hypothetical protein
LITPNDADAVDPVPPWVELMGPVVLFFWPSVVACKVTIIVQVVAALRVVPLREMEVAPFGAVKVPPQLFVSGLTTSNPAGRLSVKAIFVKFVAGLALMTVKVSVVIAFRATFAAPNALLIVGG